MQSSGASDTLIVTADGSVTGCAYLIEERKPRQCLELCEKLAIDGTNLLIVSLDPPSQLVAGTILSPKKVIWLTNLIGPDRMNPTAIGILMSEIRKFVEQSHSKSIVLIDGLEYLISLNTFDRMLQFIHQLRDMFVTSGSVLIMPIDMRTLSDREQALLERNLTVVSTSAMSEIEPADPIYHLPAREGIGT